MRKISVQKHWCTQLVWGKNVWYHRKKVVQETDVNIRYILAAGSTKPVTRFAWNGKRGQPSLFNVYDCLDVGQCIWPWKTESGMCIGHESGTNKGHDRHPNDFSLPARYPSRHKAVCGIDHNPCPLRPRHKVDVVATRRKRPLCNTGSLFERNEQIQIALHIDELVHKACCFAPKLVHPLMQFHACRICKADE